MARKSLVALVAASFVFSLILISAAGGFLAGRLTAAPSSFGPFREAWDLIHESYVDRSPDDAALIRGAIDGMTRALEDEHTSYLYPEEYGAFLTAVGGSYEGIGAEVDVSGEYLTIIALFPGSPAEQAGLKPGDQVVRINDEDMTGVDPEVARLKVLGEAGTTVLLGIRRADRPDIMEFSVVRGTIDLPTTESRMLPGGIAYIRLYLFGDRSTAELHSALQTLMAEKPRGLILDLRGNPGGLVTTAVSVASEFLPEGKTVFLARTGDGLEESQKTKSGGLALEVPMVLLVDGGSASASELLAGALMDHGRARIVGARTYGKGSIQTLFPLDGEQGALRLTTAHFFTPNGTPIHGQGILPDFPVAFSEEEFQAGTDPQLEKALQLLGAAIQGD